MPTPLRIQFIPSPSLSTTKTCQTLHGLLCYTHGYWTEEQWPPRPLKICSQGFEVKLSLFPRPPRLYFLQKKEKKTQVVCFSDLATRCNFLFTSLNNEDCFSYRIIVAFWDLRGGHRVPNYTLVPWVGNTDGISICVCILPLQVNTWCTLRRWCRSKHHIQ